MTPASPHLPERGAMSEQRETGELTAQDRAALDAWWHSDWPDGGDVLDTLVETVERILAARRETLMEGLASLLDDLRRHDGRPGGDLYDEANPNHVSVGLIAIRLKALLDAEGTGEQP